MRQRKEIDWGGCRCQALALLGDAAETDPACGKSPFHAKIEALATALLGEMQRMYPERLAERYRLTEEELGQDAYDLLETVGRKRGMLMSGGVVNTERAAITLVDEFRGAKLGRVSLERPEEA